MKKLSLVVMVIFIFAFSATSIVYAGTAMVLHLTGIEGESEVGGHEGGIDIITWSWDIGPDNMTNTDARSYQVIANPIVVKKYLDKASPFLFLKALTGEHIEEASLILRKTGEDPMDYLQIDMIDVRIIYVSPGGDANEYRAIETVALDFEQVCYRYTPEESSGGPGPTIDKCWDNKRNQPTTFGSLNPLP